MAGARLGRCGQLAQRATSARVGYDNADVRAPEHSEGRREEKQWPALDPRVKERSETRAVS
jgi:hypothetical protein